MARRRILTRAQQARDEEGRIVRARQVERELSPILEALTNLVHAPEVADMVTEVVLGGNGEKGTKDQWSELRLNSEGLVVVVGHWKDGSDWTDAGHYESSGKVAPSIRLIQQFRLTETPLLALLDELRS